MESLVPTVIIDPGMLFREGLRRILTEAGFIPAWCNEYAPVGPIAGLSDRDAPLVIVGSDIEEASIQIGEVKRNYPAARVVVLVDAATPPQFVAALRCGADTLVLRRSSCEALIATLRLVMNGVAVFPAELIGSLIVPSPQPPVLPALASDTARPPPPEGQRVTGAGLSDRERQVLLQLLEGLSNKEIARVLAITEATVKVHVKAILRKARVRNRTQVAMWASRQGLVQPAPDGGPKYGRRASDRAAHSAITLADSTTLQG